MTRCPDFELLQDYLDGEVVPEQARAIEAHLAACPDCARDLASYRLVFDRLGSLPLFDPSPQLVERILAEAMPAHPARWVKLAGWAYAASLVASLGGLLVATLSPGPRAWMGALAAEAAKSVVRSFLFVVQSVNDGVVQFLALAGSRGEWLRELPILHAVVRPLSQPVFVFTVWAAVVAGVALIWWMRPRRSRATKGSRHVGIVGF
jgi:anti-sigma factor RsiW